MGPSRRERLSAGYPFRTVAKAKRKLAKFFMRAIDIHTHPVFMGGGYTKAAVTQFAARGRALGVEKMVTLGDVLAYGRLPSGAQIEAINDQNAQVVRWAPDYFIGFCYLNPTLGARDVEGEIERCVGKLGFRGLKLEIANNARDACMRPLMRAAERWGVPVLQHSWSQTNIRQQRYHTDPADTALLARRFPNVQVIMAHLSGCGFRGVLEAKGIDNLVIDTSGGLPEANLVEYAVEHLGAAHVVYGSDLPIRETAVTTARITSAEISAADKRLLLRENARRLLKL